MNWRTLQDSRTFQNLDMKSQPSCRGITGFCPESIIFLIYVNDLPKPHHRQNSKSQLADDTALWTASKNVQFAAKLCVRTDENWQSGVPNGE